MGCSSQHAKRLLDLVVSTGGLLLLLPLLPALAVAIRLEDRGPVFRSELRAGAGRAGGPQFRLLRFRVLGDRERIKGRRAGENPRLTRVGRWLRRSGVEGWPQLLNVFLGQMSLVGPRPATPEGAERLAAECPSWSLGGSDLRPGIFGLAQLDHPRQAGFFGLVCETLLFDLEYDRRLARRGPLATVLDDISLMGTWLQRRVRGRPRAAGNDLIRIDWPRLLKQVPLDPELMAHSIPTGLGADVVAGEHEFTAFWYPPRRLPGPALETDPAVLGALCDDMRAGSGQALVLAKRLAPSGSVGVDLIRLELPPSLNDVHAVCEHLQVLWEALAPRSADRHFPVSLALLVVEGLVAAAAALGTREGRLALEVAVSPDELRLTALPLPRPVSLRVDEHDPAAIFVR